MRSRLLLVAVGQLLPAVAQPAHRHLVRGERAARRRPATDAPRGHSTSTAASPSARERGGVAEQDGLPLAHLVLEVGGPRGEAQTSRPPAPGSGR